jgi:hypothetical protein
MNYSGLGNCIVAAMSLALACSTQVGGSTSKTAKPGSGGSTSTTPGNGGNEQGGDPPTDTIPLPTPTAAVLISEIMYHPVDETTAEDEHEFVELYNSGSDTVSVAGWKLRVGKTERLTLPANTSIAAGSYLVLAKRRDRLLEVSRYAISPDVVIGDFDGGLGNGGSTVSILDAKGAEQDSVSYDDKAPWPIGADAFGAQQDWLPALGDYSTHQYMGRSLERYSFGLPSSDPRNWEASPVDGATPGRANSVSGEPPAIVLKVGAVGESSGTATIASDEPVKVTVTLSEGAVSDLELEYRQDPVETVGTSTMTVPLNLKDGTTTIYEATLPGTASNTVVRYRVRGSRDGSDVGRFGPRATDPMEYYAYFVGPTPASGRSYHLFITPQNWTTMYTNVSAGRTTGCNVNSKWDLKVPAVFVSQGSVFDVRVRYQGSNYRRTDGFKLPGWTAPGPTQPNPLTVLSWKVSFPRYSPFEGYSGIDLNKLKQGCPGVINALESAIMSEAGFPEGTFRFTRVYINGGYYAYMMDLQDTSDAQFQQFEGGSSEAIGDLFKADGVTNADTDRNVGPWGRGNFTPLAAACNLQPVQRYQYTYDRQSNDWKGLTTDGHAALIGLIEALNGIAATTDADPTVRAFFEQYFDVPKVMAQYAVRNWAGVWDDGVHNYLPYQRASDGRWVVLGQDYDCDFGGDVANCDDSGKFHNDPTMSFYYPESGTGNISSSPSQLKVQLIRAFRSEFSAKVSELSPLFSETSIDEKLTKILEGFDRAAWDEAPARFCDLDQRIDEARQWMVQRRAFFDQGVR